MGQHYYLLSTLVLMFQHPHYSQSSFVLMFSTYIHMREFSCFTSITMWGIYTIELGLYIPMMSFLKSALGLREQPSWMHPHQFHWRAFIHIQLYVHPLHGNHYSLHSFDYKTSSCPIITYSFASLSSIWPSKPPLMFFMP